MPPCRRVTGPENLTESKILGEYHAGKQEGRRLSRAPSRAAGKPLILLDPQLDSAGEAADPATCLSFEFRFRR